MDRLDSLRRRELARGQTLRMAESAFFNAGGFVSLGATFHLPATARGAR